MWQNSFQRSAIGAQLLVLAVGLMYAYITVWTPEFAVWLALNLGEKPFILRALVPWLAQGLMWLGIPAWAALMVLVAASVVGLFGALKQAPLAVGEPRWRAVLVICGLAGIALYSRVYDAPSALFMALALVTMWRKDWIGYGLIFALGSLNRETMVLVGLVYAVHFWGRLGRRTWLWVGVYQLYLYGVIRAGVMVFYADAPGKSFWLMLGENLRWHAEQPWLAVLHWVGFGVIIWMCLRNWKRADPLLRTALVVLMPVLTVLYVTLGMMGEVRVFAEALPVLFGFQRLGGSE